MEPSTSGRLICRATTRSSDRGAMVVRRDCGWISYMLAGGCAFVGAHDLRIVAPDIPHQLLFVVVILHLHPMEQIYSVTGAVTLRSLLAGIGHWWSFGRKRRMVGLGHAERVGFLWTVCGGVRDVLVRLDAGCGGDAEPY